MDILIHNIEKYHHVQDTEGSGESQELLMVL